MNATNNPVLTIGHSNHALDSFIALLHQHHITALADVRSAPVQPLQSPIQSRIVSQQSQEVWD